MGRSLDRFYIQGYLSRVFGAAYLKLPISFEIHDCPPREIRAVLVESEIHYTFGKRLLSPKSNVRKILDTSDQPRRLIQYPRLGIA
jgi:hypothetical protein